MLVVDGGANNFLFIEHPDLVKFNTFNKGFNWRGAAEVRKTRDARANARIYKRT